MEKGSFTISTKARVTKSAYLMMYMFFHVLEANAAGARGSTRQKKSVPTTVLRYNAKVF